jgi:hypothetical protein
MEIRLMCPSKASHFDSKNKGNGKEKIRSFVFMFGTALIALHVVFVRYQNATCYLLNSHFLSYNTTAFYKFSSDHFL